MTTCTKLLAVAALTISAHAPAQDWNNAGGNAGRNGLTDALGPDGPDILWSTGPTSVIAWQPVIEGGRMFVVRQTGFPPEPASNESPVICFDLNTGNELYRINIPYATDDWTAWIAGVKDGRLYAGRSGNGSSVSRPLRCYDATDGTFLWESQDSISAGFYDGVVFAPDGDPIVADFTNITRIDADTGSTVWRVSRVCSVSGNCGGALSDDGVFINDTTGGGHIIKKFDLATGAFLYQSPLMPGFLTQNAPMVGPDGTVYMNRVQNSPTVDFFYAFEDTGTALLERWSVPSGYTTSDELAVGPDGSVYFIAPGNLITRLDPMSGTVLDQNPTPIASDGTGLTPRIAIDRAGRLFLTNGEFSAGRLYSFNADLTSRWSVPFPNVNIGGPAIADDGTLIVAGTGNNLRAFRTDRCLADLAEPFGELNFFDVAAYIALYNATDPAADLADPIGELNFFDVAAFIAAYNAGCP